MRAGVPLLWGASVVGVLGSSRGDWTLGSGQYHQNPACCCMCPSAWNSFSSVFAVSESCLSPAVPHAALTEQHGLFYSVPSQSSALSTSSFPQHVSNRASDPSLHERAEPCGKMLPCPRLGLWLEA